MKETSKPAVSTGNRASIPVTTVNQEEVVPIEEPISKIPKIFNKESISQMYQSSMPIEVTSEILKGHHRKIFNNANYDSLYIMSKAEFHVNVLIFLKETFPSYPDEVICKLLNLFAELISLSKDDYPINPESHDSFLQLSKLKVYEFKEGLKEIKFLPNPKAQPVNPDNPSITTGDGKFVPTIKDLQELLSYIKIEYLPYIRIWYDFINDQRDIVNKKIEVIINQPMPSLSLNIAVEIKEPEIAKTDEDKKDQENLIDKKDTEPNKDNQENVAKETLPQTYLDLLNSMDLNSETKKIIIEKIEELNKDVENKITDRQKTLDDKVRDLEDIVKGKKK